MKGPHERIDAPATRDQKRLLLQLSPAQVDAKERSSRGSSQNYAHLERYADGLKEGHHVLRGQALGFVGTSGNAPKDTPHLHFAIFRLTDKKQWWHGSPINPYDVFK